MNAGPDDAAKRVVNDAHFGSWLGRDRMCRRGVFSGGAGSLRGGARMVIWGILRTYGAADALCTRFRSRCVGAYVYRVKLRERVIEEYGYARTNALLGRRRAA